MDRIQRCVNEMESAWTGHYRRQKGYGLAPWSESPFANIILYQQRERGG